MSRSTRFDPRSTTVPACGRWVYASSAGPATAAGTVQITRAFGTDRGSPSPRLTSAGPAIAGDPHLFRRCDPVRRPLRPELGPSQRSADHLVGQLVRRPTGEPAALFDHARHILIEGHRQFHNAIMEMSAAECKRRGSPKPRFWPAPLSRGDSPTADRETARSRRRSNAARPGARSPSPQGASRW